MKEKTKEVNHSEVIETITSNQVKNKVSELLKEINHTSDNKKVELLKSEIKNLLISYNETLDLDNTTIHNLETLGISDQNQDLKIKQNYVGFIYYFWSASTMNFKIIGLYSLEPLFELVNTQELFYLDKPTMITNDIPIFWLNRGIPFTLELMIKDDILKLNEKIFAEGYNADLIRAMVKSQHWINVYGKEKWTIRFVSFILSLMLSEGLIIYIILSNIWS